jgi:prepilin-type processing-associated H-X9-DG protein
VDANKHPSSIDDINIDFVLGVNDRFQEDVTLATNGKWDQVHDGDVEVGDKTLYRLREGIERFFITDINNPAASSLAQSELVVMHDVSWKTAAPGDGQPSFNHIPGGGNVLYMDGHVEFLKYPGGFPICPTWNAFLDLMVEALG